MQQEKVKYSKILLVFWDNGIKNCLYDRIANIYFGQKENRGKNGSGNKPDPFLTGGAFLRRKEQCELDLINCKYGNII